MRRLSIALLTLVVVTVVTVLALRVVPSAPSAQQPLPVAQTPPEIPFEVVTGFFRRR